MVAPLAAKRACSTKIDWKKLPHGAEDHRPEVPRPARTTRGTSGRCRRTGARRASCTAPTRSRSGRRRGRSSSRCSRSTRGSFTLLDGPAEVIGLRRRRCWGTRSTPTTSSELDEVQGSSCSTSSRTSTRSTRLGYKTRIIEGEGVRWARLERRRAGCHRAHRRTTRPNTSCAKEGGEFWVDAYVIPKERRTRKAAHAWIDFVYQPKTQRRSRRATRTSARRSSAAARAACSRRRSSPTPDVFPRRRDDEAPRAERRVTRGCRVRESASGQSSGLGRVIDGRASRDQPRRASPRSAKPRACRSRRSATRSRRSGSTTSSSTTTSRAVDDRTYRLEVDGLVRSPLSLSLDDIRAPAGRRAAPRRWSARATGER